MINPNKSDYLSYNGANFVITINDQNLENCSVAKYVGVYFGNNLFWNSHVDYVLKTLTAQFHGDVIKAMQVA